MTPALRELSACFEGIVPALVATAAADGMPNVSYLSQVTMVDDDHIGLTNQFLTKTSANLAENPQATVLLVDGCTCAQYLLGVRYVRHEESGALFGRMAAQIEAGSALVGMAGIMRLRRIDVFKVDTIEAVPFTVSLTDAPPRKRASLEAVARVVQAIGAQADVGSIVDATLRGLAAELDIGHALILQLMHERLVTVGSHGYPAGGIGSEVPIEEGLIGIADKSAQVIRINELSRAFRFSQAVSASAADENRSRSIRLPGLPDALSQVAVPMLVHGQVQGVLFAESARRMAFDRDDEAALVLVAGQAAAAIWLAESLVSDDGAVTPAASAQAGGGPGLKVQYYRVDDSIFFDGNYVIKGIAGRLLYYMLEQYVTVGTVEFSNRALRLDTSLRLPELKTNLETRLLLLRRRLDEKDFPVRLIQLGRGRLGMECRCIPELTVIEG